MEKNMFTVLACGLSMLSVSCGFSMFLLLGILAIRCYFMQRINAKGPRVWPLVGSIPSLIWNLNHLYDWITVMLVDTGGTFVFESLSFTKLYTVVTCKPENIEYILKTKFANFPKGDHFRNIFHDVFGDGLFTTDDDKWKRQRKIGSALLNAAKFRQHVTGWIDELVYGRLLPILEDACARSATVDVQDLLLRFTFDNICMEAMGVDPGCLLPHLPHVPFAKAFENATEASLYRFITPVYCWKAMRFLGVGMERELKKARQTLDEFVEGVIARRKKELRMDAHNENGGRWDLLSSFIQLTDDNACSNPDKLSRDFIFSFILAGRDTPSIALSWFFWLLHRHPLVEEKIYMEINLILKARPNNMDRLHRFSMDELKQMNYLQASLSESLRLYPSVPANHKEAIEEDFLPDGTHMPKGGKIVYMIYSIGRMESIWGKDCREFKPERWLSKDGVFVTDTSFKYAVFNPGSRLCLGRDLAYIQMKMVAAAIISRFHVRVVPGHPVVPRFALTLFMKHGLSVTLHPRLQPQQT
eukprot:Gb_37600 [translate_table: standard]